MFTENPFAKPRNQLRVTLKTIYALVFGREILTRRSLILTKTFVQETMVCSCLLENWLILPIWQQIRTYLW